jgi:multidrug resistance efflux pump
MLQPIVDLPPLVAKQFAKAPFAVVDSDSYYVVGYFEETKPRQNQIDDKVSIGLMGYDVPLSGRVQSIARAITDREIIVGSELIANVNPTFSWVRLAQEVGCRALALNSMRRHSARTL